VPEGDTLFRTAAGLRPHLVGRVVRAARARLPGPQANRLIGSTVTQVEAYGKHLLIRFDSGLELRSHLGMNGSWHRYRPGERWRRAPSRAHLVLEVPNAIAVLFDAAAVELYETRIEYIHPVLTALGPDILAEDFDATEAVRRLADPSRATMTIAEALLDQRALAGIGNIYKNETLFLERVNPFTPTGSIDAATLERLVTTARRLMRANIGTHVRDTLGGSRGASRGRRWVYGRAGRPCRRCGTLIESRRHGELPRITSWCPACQSAAAAVMEPAKPRHTMVR
jgi:endonuclease-8